MCGRIVQAEEPERYAEWFRVDRIVAGPRPRSWNVAPTTEVYAVVDHEGERLLGTLRWGLVPFWAKDPRIGSRLVNARAETLATRPAFRDPFRHRRCLVPADGFYEWERREGRRGKVPHYVYGRDGRPLALAGLWSSWEDPDGGGRLRTCTIVTGRPNELVGRLHDRMPVILPPQAWDPWLDPDLDDPDALRDLLATYPAESLAEHAVSTLVNRVTNDAPELTAPVREGQ